MDTPPLRLEFTLKSRNAGLHSDVPVEQAELYRKRWSTNYWKSMKTRLRKQKTGLLIPSFANLLRGYV